MIRQAIEEGDRERILDFISRPDVVSRGFFQNCKGVIREYDMICNSPCLRCNLCTLIHYALICRCHTTLELALKRKHTSPKCELPILTPTGILGMLLVGGYSRAEYDPDPRDIGECVDVLMRYNANPLQVITVIPRYGSSCVSMTCMRISLLHNHDICSMIDHLTSSSMRLLRRKGGNVVSNFDPESMRLLRCGGRGLLCAAFNKRMVRSFEKLTVIGCELDGYTFGEPSMLHYAVALMISPIQDFHQDHLHMLDLLLYAGMDPYKPYEEMYSAVDRARTGLRGEHTNHYNHVSLDKGEQVSFHLKTFHRRVTLRRVALTHLLKMKFELMKTLK